jgi:hypothetical protein
MRSLSADAEEELKLHLVQETSQQLTFQRGKRSHSEAIAQGWRKSTPGLLGLSVFMLLPLTFMLRAGVFSSIPSNPIGINLFMMVWGMGFFGIPLATLAYSLLSACFVTWTFDRLDRTVCREAINLVKQKNIKIYRFDEIAKISVEQAEDSDNSYLKCCKLYFDLTSGRKFTLSQSCETTDRREQAIALQYHRELADLMRNCLGQVTPAAEKADRVFIPDAREVAAEDAANWEMLKSLGGALFSSKEKRLSDIENTKEKLITDRENAQLWETLSFHLAMSKEHYRESIDALSRAEAIYRERGDITKADDLARKISLFQAKI